ncbi:MAG: SDR family oxidoreductase [Alphaproteobacteria bacterium]|nr:SDR family oxidoreductase [Alphaproteobacteria bacterium]
MGEPRLFCFGLGYTARVLAAALMGEGWTVAGTCRDEATRADLAADGIDAFLFDRDRPLDDAGTALGGATHLLSSVPPDAEGDPVLARHAGAIAAMEGLAWAGYLSSTGVYGDTGGAPVDETAAVNPTSERGRRRAEAEEGWLDLRRAAGVPVHVFRLSGIYGPGRSALDTVRAGQARRIDKPGHLFARVHVDDIAAVLRASMARPGPGAVYNVCDDEPAPAADVVAFACELLGVDAPPLVPFHQAAGEMSPMALSFWRDNRRVDNSRIKGELGVRMKFPDYRAGLRAVLAAEE